MQEILKQAIFIIFMGLNLFSFILFFIDKRKAINGSKRIPEKNFFYLSLAGGWVLGIIAIFIMRHKNKKISFMLKYILATLPSVGFLAFNFL